MRTAVDATTYDAWLAPLEPLDWDGNVLHVGAPTATRAWISDRYGRLLERTARRVLGDGARIALTSSGSPAAGARRTERTGGSTHTPPSVANSPRPARLIPRYRFDQFIIGDGNRHAHAAALAVAESPGQTYNPLFLCAPPGRGKTHLLHAIGNYITEFDPDTTVLYTTVEAFTNGFLSALGDRSLPHFKALYRDVDVLLIDDVQFLAQKAKTEEEFFHTFNALHDTGRQLVLTCDRLPRQLTGIEDRLRERFEAGLVEHLQAPDHSVRVAILRKRASLDGLVITDPGVFELIAERVTDNIRALEGALIRIVAHGSLTHRPIDVELAASVLRDVHPPPDATREPDAHRVQRVVATFFQLTPDDLRSPSRAAKTAWARQLAIFLVRRLTTDSLQDIGGAFGGRNHATVLHACKRVSERTATSHEDAADLDALMTLLTDSGADRGS